MRAYPHFSENMPAVREVQIDYERAEQAVQGLRQDEKSGRTFARCPECRKEVCFEPWEGHLLITSKECRCHPDVIVNGLMTLEARKAGKKADESGVNGHEPKESKQRQPRGYTAEDLQKMEIPPTCWTVPGYIPEGLTIFAGGQKLGKSRIIYDTMVAIATGGKAFGNVDVVQGGALYLALEDSDIRLQDRLAEILGDSPAPANLHLFPEWPAIVEGGLPMLRSWLKEHEDTRIVAIDTLGAFRAGMKVSKGGTPYQDDYDLGRTLLRICREFHLSMVIAHHINKNEEWTDPFNAVSGTIGLTGAADATLIFQRPRGSNEGRLLGTGRDLMDLDKTMKLNEVTGVWEVLEDYQDQRKSCERQAIIALIGKMGALGPAEVADLLEKNRGTVRSLMLWMFRDGDLTRDKGKYSVAEREVKEHWDQ